GFAISSNLVTDIAGQLVATGHVTNSHRAELGVQVATVLDPNGAPTGVGIEAVVPGGPAAAAGLRAGEVVTAVNNTPVRSTSELAAALAHLDPGQTIPVTIAISKARPEPSWSPSASCPGVKRHPNPT
ncbi:MAG: S1C family serine protease, partial [Pseudonocardiaceae bacterium]